MSLIARIAATAAALGLAAVPAVPSPGTAYDAQRPLPSHVNHCWSSDNGYPVVDDATFSPSSVDVSSAPATVTMTVHAHDTGGPGPASGIRQVLAPLTWPRSTLSLPRHGSFGLHLRHGRRRSSCPREPHQARSAPRSRSRTGTASRMRCRKAARSRACT